MKRISSSFILLLITLSSMCLSSCADKGKTSNGSISSDSSKTSQTGRVEFAIPDDNAFSTSSDPNGSKFDLSNVQKASSSLEGKKIYWLGSSVTYGQASNGVAMSEYISALTGCECKKDAVSSTTILCDNESENTGAKSYLTRLMNSTIFDKDENIDAFICQISTNDCISSYLSKRGEITEKDDIDVDDFNSETTLGGVETIIAYVFNTWHCPIYFYSGSYFADGLNKSLRQNNDPKGSDYAVLISQVKQISNKWNEHKDVHVGVIDMFNDDEFNQLASEKYYSWAMKDPIHPKKAAYLQWWSPYIIKYLENDLDKK